MKRFLIGALAALMSVAAMATTPSPVSLLNTAGSTAGQVIGSSGPTSTAAWGNVSASALAAQAANTVVANVTGSSASPTAFSMPSCSTSASALDWTSGTGFTCNASINAATLGGATFASPPIAGYGSATPEPVFATTVSATGLISPTSTIGIKGTTLADSAQAGSWGEYQTFSAAAANATTFTALNATSTTTPLSAGDWDIQCEALFTAAGSTVMQIATVGVSTSSTPTVGAFGTYTEVAGTTSAGFNQVLVSPVVRESFASATTVYCPASAGFTVSTLTITGLMRVRRVR